MTVTYSLNVANARLTGFSKLLLRWKGSIYKLLYREMAIYVALYYSLSFIYRYVLTDSHRVPHNMTHIVYIISFLLVTWTLGRFYVSIVVTRWWQQFMQIPWLDKIVMLIAGNVHGSDERGRIIRRTLARYLLLLMTLTCQAVSTSVRRRFPTLDHVEEAGIMTKEERMVYDKIPGTHGKYWAPTVWFTNLIIRARKEGRIKDDILLKQLLDELHVYRSCCGMMFAYDWISIPLVYTQTVTIATYTYFVATIIGRQYLDPSKGYSNHDVDLYIPIFTIFEFFFFMGWLKVAEQLINPYGEDDDDFELNWCLDRNLLVSFWIVDEMHKKHPRLVKDMYWDESEPVLPYTKSSFGLRTQPYLGSALNLNINPDDAEFVPMETIMEEDNNDQYSSAPTSPGNDLISMEGTAVPEKEHDGTSHSRLNFLTGSIRGSRLFNMLMGQSTENVATPTNRDKSLGHPLMPPFTLKTPKKRTRTTSVSEPPKLMPAASSLQVSHLGSDVNRNNLSAGYPDIPTAPVILTHRTPTRQGTPVSNRRSFISDSRDNSRESSIDMSADIMRGRYPGKEGFSFPTSFVPPSNQQQFFQNLLPTQLSLERQKQQNEDEDDDEEVDIKTPEIQTPVLSESGTRCSSRLDTISHTVVEVDEEVSPAEQPTASPSAPCLLTGSPEKAEEISPFEPSLSDESLTPYDSNQSTVTSITELLKQEKKANNDAA